MTPNHWVLQHIKIFRLPETLWRVVQAAFCCVLNNGFSGCLLE
nr:hypothetical protein [Alysiella crassa]